MKKRLIETHGYPQKKLLNSNYWTASSHPLKSCHKYSGCGNAFIVIDHRTPFFPFTDKDAISYLCSKHEVDGILLIKNSESADFKMRIFNADGSEAEMCGNGVRCAVKYLRDQKISSSKQITLETLGNNVCARIQENTISVDLPPPIRIQWNVPLIIDAERIYVHFLNTGVPHTVLFNAKQNLGPKIRHHAAFSPEGTNVTFVTPSYEGCLEIATYERGVEKITQACGTGALAAAVAANKLLQLPSPITLYPPSRDPLTVSFQTNENKLSSLSLTGPVKFLEEIPFSLEGNSIYL